MYRVNRSGPGPEPRETQNLIVISFTGKNNIRSCFTEKAKDQRHVGLQKQQQQQQHSGNKDPKKRETY